MVYGLISPNLKLQSISGFHSTCLVYLEYYVENVGENLQKLYTLASFDRDNFNLDTDRLNEEQLNSLLYAAKSLLDKPDFGFSFMSLFTPFSFGNVSKALIGCCNLEQLLKRYCQYYRLINPYMLVDVSHSASEVVIRVRYISKYKLINHVLGEGLVCTAVTVERSLFQGQKIFSRLYLPIDKPSYDKCYKKYFDRPIEYGSDAGAIHIPIELLKTPVTVFDPVVGELALRELDEQIMSAGAKIKFSEKVSRLVRNRLYDTPTLTEIAAKFNMTERTFRRKLSEENTNYREILKQVRYELSIRYLSEGQLSIDKIAQQIGYKDSDSFRKAFSEWSNLTVSEWKKRKIEKLNS